MIKFKNVFLLLIVVLSSNIFAGNVSSSIHDDGTNVGIGTQSPLRKFHVYDGTQYNNGEIMIGGTGGTGLVLGHINLGSGRSWISSLNDSSAENNERISIGFGQISNGDPSNTILVVDQGVRVGVGTKEPKQRLHVSGGNLAVDHGHKMIVNQGNGDNNWISSMDGTPGPKLGIFTASVPRVVVSYQGEVSIGSQDPVNGYKLTVNGGIYALDLRIRPDLSNTADFVFEDDYNLMSLEQVKSNIRKNKHLPGIPSAKEMVEKGVSVAEMQAKLLQKIEELTLYVIDQNEKIELLTNQNESQAKEIQTLQNQINPDKLVSVY